ncbi:MAG: Crp/Fnr family transcriptional regulator, partial [Chloroflexota bacterium]
LEGDPCDGLHLIVSGLGRIYRLSPAGREQVLALLHRGDSCNEVPVIDGGNNPANLVAVEDTTTWSWSQQSIEALQREIPQLREQITRSLAVRCRELVDQVYRLSFLSVTHRLVVFLLQQSQTGDSLDRGRWTQEDIASHVGTVREMVSRSLRNLENDGLIELTRSVITIRDRKGLASLL